MTKVAYIDGQYTPESSATVSIFDRGFLFADAVYEVSAVVQGRLIDNDRHLERLESSLGKIGINPTYARAEIAEIQRNLINKNELVEGVVYIQVSRGAADRDFAYPSGAMATLVKFTQEKTIVNARNINEGISIKVVPEIRWQRRDIKTVGLLAQSMAKQTALEDGQQDAWMEEDGFLTEGSSSNIFIVAKNGHLVTRDLSNKILAGITRRAVLELAREQGLDIEERPISVEEVFSAEEAFSTSASTLILPVCQIDGRLVGAGSPGEKTLSLYNQYLAKYVNHVM